MNYVVALLAILGFSVALADEEPSRLNVVHFAAEARAQVPNDEVEILLNVQNQGQRPSELAKQLNADMQWALGIAEKSPEVKAQTLNYRTEPRYDRSGTVIGWQVSQSLRLTATEIEQATALATTLQERLLIKSMQFQPSDATREKIEDRLTVQALKRFRERAEMIRAAMGMGAYEVVDIQLGNRTPPPMPVFGARMATAMEPMSAVAAEPGTSDQVVTVNGTIQLH